MLYIVSCFYKFVFSLGKTMGYKNCHEWYIFFKLWGKLKLITIVIQWCTCLHNEKCIQLLVHASYQFTVYTAIRSCDLRSF